MIIAKDVLTLLSAMINMVPPGASDYSRVMLPYCDEKCQTEKICNDPTKHTCKKPQFEQWYYDKLISEQYSIFGEKAEKYRGEFKYQSFSRAESYEEGLLRYLTIAQSVHEIGEDAVNHGWVWNKDQLKYMLLTVARGESSFRRDIHSGHGKWSRGDCAYFKQTTGKKTYKTDPEGVRVCRSVCLGQIKLDMYNGEQVKTKEGWSAKDLVGTDLESTKRCFSVSARYMSSHRKWCATQTEQAYDDWAASVFTAYGTGHTCKHLDNEGKIKSQTPLTRAKIFWKYFHNRKPLNKSVQENLLNLITEQKTYVPNWVSVVINK